MTHADTPRVTVVVPAYNEDEHIVPVLDRLFESVHLRCEVLVVSTRKTTLRFRS
jgi:dolichol-phosphate mannosyltransferase